MKKIFIISILMVVFVVANSQETFYPVVTNVLNVKATTTHITQFYVNDDVVTITGTVDIEPVDVGRASILLSLPVNADFKHINDCSGKLVCEGKADFSGGIVADVEEDKIKLALTADDKFSHRYYFVCHYKKL